VHVPRERSVAWRAVAGGGAVLLIVVGLWLLAATATGQAPAPTSLWREIAAGGGASSGGEYRMESSLTHVAQGWSSGGPYALAGRPVRNTAGQVYLPRLYLERGDG